MKFDRKNQIKTATVREMPTAVVLADQVVQGELRDIFGDIEVASLLVAGKTVVEHILLELQEMRVQQCIVLAGENAAEIQRLINSDGRWGMTVSVMNYTRSKEQVLREFKSLSEPSGLLVIEANCLRGGCLKAFLDQAALSEYSLLEAKVGSESSGITLLKPTNADFIINAMPISLPDVHTNALQTASEFHKANFDVISGLFDGLEPSVMVNSQVGRRQHWSSHVSSQNSVGWVDVMIDKHCQIGKGVTLNSVILNHDVYIANRSELKNTIVMPNAIITSSKGLANSIVHRDAIFDLS